MLDAKPHIIHYSQRPEKLTDWAGIFGEHYLGIFLSTILNGFKYNRRHIIEI